MMESFFGCAYVSSKDGWVEEKLEIDPNMFDNTSKSVF